MKSAIAVFLGVLCYATFLIGSATAAQYDTCVKDIEVEGKVFALFKNAKQPDEPCWSYVRNGTTVKAENLDDRGRGSYQFTIIIPKNTENLSYDHMFSILIKELKEKDEETDPYIDLLREKMKTLCRRSGSKRFVPATWEEFASEFPGFKFNKFHNSASVTRGRLANFHVAFVNAQKRCVRTDDEEGEYRKSFYIDGVEFPDVPEFRLIANLLRPFQSDSAFAALKKAEFKKYRVRIKQATFSQTGMLSANFYVSEGEKSDIKIQDLSKNRIGQRLLLRPYLIQIR